jgi:uncharacterized protein YndB with AHSA1/START domain
MSSVATLTKSAVIDAPVEKAFDYALDMRNLWAVPDVALANVELKPEGTGSSARLFSHFLGFHLEGGPEYTEVVRPKRIVAKVSFFGEHPTWTFTFEPVDDGTKLTVQGEWHIGVPAVGKTLEGLMVREHREMVDTMLATSRPGWRGRPPKGETQHRRPLISLPPAASRYLG